MNPFADLIPQNAQAPQGGGSAMDNPFADLIPQGGGMQAPPKQEGFFDRLANSEPVNAILGAGDATQNMLANLVNLSGSDVPLAKSGEGLSYDIGNIAGNVGNFFLPMGAVSKAAKAVEGVPILGHALGGAFRQGAAAGAGYGAVMNPEDRLKGAAIEGALGGVGGKIGDVVSKMLPSNLFRGSLSPEQLQRNLDVSRGTMTPLGDVIESPYLKRLFENKLAPSGLAEKELSAAGTQVLNKGQDIISGYLGKTDPLKVEDKLGEALIKAYKDQNQFSRSLYKGAEDLADEIKLPLKTSGFNSTLKENSDLLSNIKLDKPDQLLLDKALQPSSLMSQLTGAPGSSPLTLKEANILAGSLNRLAKQYGASAVPADRFMAKNVGELGRSLKSDIRTSIDKSGNTALKDAYTGAEKNYKENFSPFLDKDIYKFIGGQKSAEDLLGTFIKTGRNTDKSQQLNKLMSKFDPETQNLAKYAYFSRAIKGAEDERMLDPMAFKNLWSHNNLGIKQKNALVPNAQERKMLDDYSKLVGMNKEPLNKMLNPMTGQRGLGSGGLGHISDIGVALGGHTLGGIPGALGALLVKGTSNKYLINKLTSEEAREKLIKKMIEKSGRNGQDSLAQSLSAAIPAGIGQSVMQR